MKESKVVSNFGRFLEVFKLKLSTFEPRNQLLGFSEKNVSKFGLNHHPSLTADLKGLNEPVLRRLMLK